MTNQKNQDNIDKFLEKWETVNTKYQKWYLSKFKELLKRIGKLIPILIGYSFMSWMFMGLYDTMGFNKTIIILLVGVLWYGIQQRTEIPKP